jgi:uncharacterized protein DUF3854
MNFLNGSIHHHDPQRKDESAIRGRLLVGPEPVGSALIGSDLTTADYAALESRWIDRESANRARLRRADSLTGSEVVGRKGGNYSGILISYFYPGSDQVREYRLRRDHPDFEYDSVGNLKVRQKYLSPSGRSNMLYLPPGVAPSLLRDPALPIVITEGEFKTLALWRAANHGVASQPRFLPVGFSGVYNWRGTIGKTVGPDGSRMDVKGAIPDLGWLVWAGRRVVVAYDADAVTKEFVRIARSVLAAHLRGRGAVVGFLEWDIAKGKGIDDHLAAVGPEVVLDEIAHVDFASSAWKRDLIRSKPPNAAEGRILPVLANANAAFRHAPEWGGVLGLNELDAGPSFSNQLPGASPQGRMDRLRGPPRSGMAAEAGSPGFRGGRRTSRANCCEGSSISPR